MEIFVNSLNDLPTAARELASVLRGHGVVALYGGMGAGKTTLIAALMREMGSPDDVTSPTFAIVNDYLVPPQPDPEGVSNLAAEGESVHGDGGERANASSKAPIADKRETHTPQKGYPTNKRGTNTPPENSLTDERRANASQESPLAGGKQTHVSQEGHPTGKYGSNVSQENSLADERRANASPKSPIAGESGANALKEPPASDVSRDRHVYHFDFYRIDDPHEAFDLGYEEYFYGGELCLVEWPEKIESLLPDDTLRLHIEMLPDGRRRIFSE